MYIRNPNKNGLSAHCIGGRLEDLIILKNIIADKLSKTETGLSFNIEEDYGKANTVTAKFFVMPTDFDPASMDKKAMYSNADRV